MPLFDILSSLRSHSSCTLTTTCSLKSLVVGTCAVPSSAHTNAVPPSASSLTRQADTLAQNRNHVPHLREYSHLKSMLEKEQSAQSTSRDRLQHQIDSNRLAVHQIGTGLKTTRHLTPSEKATAQHQLALHRRYLESAIRQKHQLQQHYHGLQHELSKQKFSSARRYDSDIQRVMHQLSQAAVNPLAQRYNSHHPLTGAGDVLPQVQRALSLGRVGDSQMRQQFALDFVRALDSHGRRNFEFTTNLLGSVPPNQVPGLAGAQHDWSELFNRASRSPKAAKYLPNVFRHYDPSVMISMLANSQQQIRSMSPTQRGQAAAAMLEVKNYDPRYDHADWQQSPTSNLVGRLLRDQQAKKVFAKTALQNGIHNAYLLHQNPEMEHTLLGYMSRPHVRDELSNLIWHGDHDNVQGSIASISQAANSHERKMLTHDASGLIAHAFDGPHLNRDHLAAASMFAGSVLHGIRDADSQANFLAGIAADLGSEVAGGLIGRIPDVGKFLGPVASDAAGRFIAHELDQNTAAPVDRRLQDIVHHTATTFDASHNADFVSQFLNDFHTRRGHPKDLATDIRRIDQTLKSKKYQSLSSVREVNQDILNDMRIWNRFQ